MRTLILTLALIAPISASACPLVDGKFTKSTGENRGKQIGLYSFLEGGQYLYNFDIDDRGTYYAADGVKKRIEGLEGDWNLTLSCSGNTVFLTVDDDIDGMQYKASYSLINKNTLLFKNSDVPEMDGEYIRE
jgi:hypothetical protein